MSMFDVQQFFVLTHEYSDRSGFSVCGVTDNLSMAMTWTAAGEENKAYQMPINNVLPTHPRSNGWPEWKP